MSEEEKKAIEELKEEINKPVEVLENKFDTFILYNIENAKIILSIVDKQQKEIEEMREELQMYVDTNLMIEQQQKEIEELKKDRKALVDNYNKVLGSFISKDKIREIHNKRIGQYMKFYQDIEELLKGE